MSRDVYMVVGTVVGAYFGDPTMGYAIGSMVGNTMDPMKVAREGPRLNDLKVQMSDYGRPIPKVYGASRLAGNVIWATDVKETSHSETSGGKGGGPEVTSTTYTYSQSFAIALCEGEIDGIGKIWANGKLVYNVGPDASVETIRASEALAAGIRFYPGSETQAVDSLIESYVGVGSTPAYRGTAYIVFEDMQLANYGNRMPNLEFEVIEQLTLATTTVGSGDGSGYAIFKTPSGYIAANSTTIKELDSALNTVRTTTTPFTILNTLPWISNDGLRLLAPHSAGLLIYEDSVVREMPGISYWVGAAVSYPVTTFNDYYVIGRINDYRIDVVDQDGVHQFWVDQDSATYDCVALFISSTGDLFAFCGIYNGSTFNITVRQYQLEASYAILKHVYQTGHTVSSVTNANAVFLEDTTTGLIYLTLARGNNDLRIIEIDASTFIFLVYSHTKDCGQTALVGRNIYLPNAWQFLGYGDDSLFNVDTKAFSTPSPAIAVSFCAVAETNDIVTVMNTTANSAHSIRFNTPTPTAQVLSSSVSNICTRAGLTAGQIDVTQLTDTITGYVTQRSTARAQIEQLMQAFYFDATESDGKVKFVKRGGAASLTIAEDDLAAHLMGGQFPDNLLLERKQELELPAEVNIQYMDTDAAYQVGSQRSQRLTVDSDSKLTLNLAISMDGSKAKQVSDVLMYDAWTSRTSFSMQNSWKYSYLEPTDVIGVAKGASTYNVRLTDEDAASGVYSRGAVLDDASVYTQSANAAPPVAPTTNVSAAAIIKLFLMDIPLLRDQDDGVGFYAAASKYAGTWAGEQTYKSSDNGASWTQSGRAILNEATVGAASTALSNFLGGNIFDELNSVTVTMLNGTLSSATELAVLNGANVLLLGNEILQFKSAELISTGIYKLTGLLRGRRGTEWAMSTHAIGDRAVLLTTNTTYLFESSNAEYNLARQYRGAALGGFLEDALTVSFTNTAVAQECYSPVLLGGGRDAANNLLLTWTRRTRIGGAWNDYADVPIGEASEAYVVEIYSSSSYATLLRTISGITTNSTTYTAAQQTTDGLTPGNTVYWIVYQVSATVGNGYGARGAT